MIENGATTETLVLRADHAALRALRPWLDQCLRLRDAEQIGIIELAIQELAANVVDHADTADERLTITLEQQGGAVWVELRDDGRPVELPCPTTKEPHPRVGGYGMMIVEQLTSSLRYERVGNENVWSAEFACETPPQPGPESAALR